MYEKFVQTCTLILLHKHAFKNENLDNYLDDKNVQQLIYSKIFIDFVQSSSNIFVKELQYKDTSWISYFKMKHLLYLKVTEEISEAHKLGYRL